MGKQNGRSAKGGGPDTGPSAESPKRLRDDNIAPAGHVWVCGACGKTARDRYGGPGKADYGWDEACMLNSVLVDERTIRRGPDGRVISVSTAWEGA